MKVGRESFTKNRLQANRTDIVVSVLLERGRSKIQQGNFIFFIPILGLSFQFRRTNSSHLTFPTVFHLFFLYLPVFLLLPFLQDLTTRNLSNPLLSSFLYFFRSCCSFAACCNTHLLVFLFNHFTFSPLNHITKL